MQPRAAADRHCRRRPSRRRARDELPADAPIQALETKEVERRAVDLVLAARTRLGRDPVEQAHNNPGFDILSTQPTATPIRIEVKGRIAGAKDFFVTHNEVILGLNSAPRYRLALVRVVTRRTRARPGPLRRQPFRRLRRR